jgi:OOP family OmpA-OmpF porin
MMKKAHGIKLGIEGHADSDGGDEANQKLSEQRAKAVADAIAEVGIDKPRMASTGFGEEKPIADNSTAVGRSKNKMVDLRKK